KANVINTNEKNWESSHSGQLHHQGADRSQLSANAHQLERRPVHEPVHTRALRMVSLRPDNRGHYIARFFRQLSRLVHFIRISINNPGVVVHQMTVTRESCWIFG